MALILGAQLGEAHHLGVCMLMVVGVWVSKGSARWRASGESAGPAQPAAVHQARGNQQQQLGAARSQTTTYLCDAAVFLQLGQARLGCGVALALVVLHKQAHLRVLCVCVCVWGGVSE